MFKIDRRRTFSVDGLVAKNTLPGLRIKNNAVPGLKKNAGFCIKKRGVLNKKNAGLRIKITRG